MTTLKDLEARVAALEARKEQEIACRLENGPINGIATYNVQDDAESCYVEGTIRRFPLRKIVIALAKKAGLKIFYHYPTGERVEFK